MYNNINNNNLPCEWESNPKYSSTSLASEIRKVQYLTGLRNFTVNDVLGYTMQLYDNNLPSHLSRKDFHDCFSWIRQQLDYDSDLSKYPRSVTVLDLLFNVFDKDEDNEISSFEFALGLSVLCGGTMEENFRTAFNVSLTNSNINSKSNNQRNISTKDAYEAYCSVFRLLYQLYDEILLRVGCDPDYYSRALTLRAFHRHNKHHRRHRHHHKHSKHKHIKHKKKFRTNIKLSTFLHWYRIGIEHIICEVPMLVDDHYNGGGLHITKEDTSKGHHHSMISMADAIRILGLHKFTPSMIIKYVIDLCDEDGTITDATFHQGIIKLIRKHYITLPIMDRPLADHILTRLFIVFQVPETERCTFTDIASGLLVFCGGSLERKAKAIFSLYSQKLLHSPTKSRKILQNYEMPDEGITHEGICSCLTSIFKIVSDLDPGHHFDSIRSCEEIAHELANDIFIQNPQYQYEDNDNSRGMLPLDAFTVVFRQIMMKFDANIDSSNKYNDNMSLNSDSNDDNESINSNSSEEYMATLQRTRSTEPDFNEQNKWMNNNDENESSTFSENTNSTMSDYNNQNKNYYDHSKHSVHRHHEHVYANDSNDDDSMKSDMINDDESAHVLSEIQQARHILHLNGLSCHDILDVLSEFATTNGTSVNNQITLPSWLLILSYFTKLNSASNNEFVAATQLGQRIFAAILNCSNVIGSPTHTGVQTLNNSIPYINLAIGVSLVLCENYNIVSSIQDMYEDKLLMAFTLLDFDNDQMISMDEMKQLVKCMLVVLQTCSPTAANKITRSGENIYNLGDSLVNMMFETSKIKNNKYIAFEEFKLFAQKCITTFDM